MRTYPLAQTDKRNFDWIANTLVHKNKNIQMTVNNGEK